MAINVAGPLLGRTNGGAASFTIASSASVGDIVVVLVGSGAQPVSSVTDSLGNTYTLDDSNSTWAFAAIYRSVITVAGASTITVTLAGSTHACGHAYLITGAANPPDDQSNFAASGGGGSTAVSVVVPATVSGQPNRAVLGIEVTFLGSGAVTMTGGAGFTATSANSIPTSGQTVSITTEYKIVSSTAAQTVDGTMAFSVLWDVVGATYLEAAAVTPTGTGSAVQSDLPQKLRPTLLTTKPLDATLDLFDGVGQREVQFEFLLIDAQTGQQLRTLTPYADSTPRLVHDTTRTIKRTLDLALNPSDTAAVDPIAHRIRVRATINGVRYPLGKYMFTDQTKLLFPSTSVSSVSLVDEMFIVDQQITESFSARDVNGSQQPAVELITQLLETLGYTPIMDNSGFLVVGTWTIGTTRGTIISNISDIADYFTPWFANDEQFHMVRTFDPANVVPTFDWDAGNKVFASSISSTSDVLHAPNRFVVISNTLTDDSLSGPIVGTYDVPQLAPHSIANRGFVVADVQQLPVETLEQAAAAARTLGIKSTVYERETVVTALDPRHDGYDIVHWRGEKWLELGWTIECVPGGQMQHTLRRTYE